MAAFIYGVVSAMMSLATLTWKAQISSPVGMICWVGVVPMSNLVKYKVTHQVGQRFCEMFFESSIAVLHCNSPSV